MPSTPLRSHRVTLFISLLVLGTAGIATLSLIRSPGRFYFFAHQDKLGHFIAYLVLAWLAARAFAVYSSRRPFLLLVAFLYAGFIGTLLEFLQPLLTRSRQGELLDLVANLVGALCGCVIFCLFPGFSSNHEHDKSVH